MEKSIELDITNPISKEEIEIQKTRLQDKIQSEEEAIDKVRKKLNIALVIAVITLITAILYINTVDMTYGGEVFISLFIIGFTSNIAVGILTGSVFVAIALTMYFIFVISLLFGNGIIYNASIANFYDAVIANFSNAAIAGFLSSVPVSLFVEIRFFPSMKDYEKNIEQLESELQKSNDIGEGEIISIAKMAQEDKDIKNYIFKVKREGRELSLYEFDQLKDWYENREFDQLKDWYENRASTREQEKAENGKEEL